MATDNNNIKSLPMNGGDGRYSYSRNSYGQKHAFDLTKEQINEAIIDKFDEKLFSNNIIRIADLGCASGPNTFNAVQNLIDPISIKCESLGLDSKNLEFQVFFNDQDSNDFNTLFKSLPSDRKYYLAGVPGSFHGRLFPKESIHFFNCSSSIHWLSRVPKELVDKNSPAFNKENVCFVNASREVKEVYAAKFAEDFQDFLNARAVEIVPGGLLVILLAGMPLDLKSCLTIFYDLIGAALLDLANMGLISKEKVESFSFPMYFPVEQEFQELIERNDSFSIVKMWSMNIEVEIVADTFAMQMRSGTEELIGEYFGNEIVETLFDRFKMKIVESSVYSDSSYKKIIALSSVLKRKLD
ncbi:hypothetical protein ACFE04_005852 [Oxalis oulophora]